MENYYLKSGKFGVHHNDCFSLFTLQGLLLKELEPSLTLPWLAGNTSAAGEGAGPKVAGVGSGRTFECPHCGQTFPSTYRLKRHQISHTGERPYRCSQCDATFTRLDHMKRHVANVHK